MKQVHTLVGQDEKLFADVTENDGEFFISDGWNMGGISSVIVFPNVNTARFYIAGKWGVHVSTVVLHSVRAIVPELSDDEKIVKAVRQFERGIILEDEMVSQIIRILVEANEMFEGV